MVLMHTDWNIRPLLDRRDDQVAQERCAGIRTSAG